MPHMAGLLPPKGKTSNHDIDQIKIGNTLYSPRAACGRTDARAPRLDTLGQRLRNDGLDVGIRHISNGRESKMSMPAYEAIRLRS